MLLDSIGLVAEVSARIHNTHEDLLALADLMGQDAGDLGSVAASALVFIELFALAYTEVHVEDVPEGVSVTLTHEKELPGGGTEGGIVVEVQARSLAGCILAILRDHPKVAEKVIPA